MFKYKPNTKDLKLDYKLFFKPIKDELPIQKQV